MKYLLLSLVLFATPAFADEWHGHHYNQNHPDYPESFLNTFVNHINNPCYSDDCKLVYDIVEQKVFVALPVESEPYIRYQFQPIFYYH